MSRKPCSLLGLLPGNYDSWIIEIVTRVSTAERYHWLALTDATRVEPHGTFLQVLR